MKYLPITPHTVVQSLTTGHFYEKSGYFAYRPYGTDDWLLIFTVSGRGRFGYAGGELTTDADDLILLRPGTLHDYGVEPGLQQWELLWAHFRPRHHWLDWLNWPEVATGLMRLSLKGSSLQSRVLRRLADAHALAQGAHRLRDDLAMNALEEVLLWCDEANPRSRQARIDQRVQEAMEYACQHLSDKLSLSELSEIAGLSVSRMSHLFRRQVGLTPQQYVERQRISRACQLLRLTGKSIKEISSEVGFESPFYFTLRFKRLMKASPKKWRAAEG